MTLPRTRIEDHRHDGIVRAVKLDPRDRFVVAAGDDRMIRVWDRGGRLRWSVGYPGAGSLFYQSSSRGSRAQHCAKRQLRSDGCRVFHAAPRPHRRLGRDQRRAPGVIHVGPGHEPRSTGIWSFPGRKGPAPARELRILDVSRNAAVLSIPWERLWDCKPGSRLANSRECSARLPVPGRGWASQPRAGDGNSTLLIADLAEARVVARLPNGDHGPSAPRARCSS